METPPSPFRPEPHPTKFHWSCNPRARLDLRAARSRARGWPDGRSSLCRRGPPSPGEPGLSESSWEVGLPCVLAELEDALRKSPPRLALWALTRNPPNLSWHFGNVNKFAGFLVSLQSKGRTHSRGREDFCPHATHNPRVGRSHLGKALLLVWLWESCAPLTLDFFTFSNTREKVIRVNTFSPPRDLLI